MRPSPAILERQRAELERRQGIERRQRIAETLLRDRREADRRRTIDRARVAAWIDRFTEARRSNDQ